MKSSFKRSVLLLTLFLSFSLLNGQTNTDRYVIRNCNGAVTPSIASQTQLKAIKSKQNSSELFKGKYFRIIQFYVLPTSEQKNEWKTKGLHLIDYLSGNSYYAVIDAGFDFSALSNEVRAVLPIDEMFKKEPKLYKKAPSELASSASTLKLSISYFEGLNGEDVIADLKSLGADINEHRSYAMQIDITIPASLYTKISNLPYIQFISPAHGEPVPEEYNFRNSSGRTNFVNTNFNGLNYNGRGVTVAIGEPGVLDGNIDVQNRLTETSTGVSDHKMGVMQNCTGAGNMDPSNRNNCWGANVISTVAYPDYVSFYNLYNLLYTNHSYGDGTIPIGGYNDLARAHDLRIASYPNHLVIYSTGNSGTSTGYTPYTFPTWSTVTGAMKMSKDMLAVGSLLPNDDLADFSSRGPMYDGRIIPQIVVEGNEGTSFATPKITGIIAILSQIYQEKKGVVPPSSLLRAILMNTADDVDNPGPDFKTGYGRANVRRAYNVISNGQYTTSSVSNGGVNAHSIIVPAGTKQVRVMIVWPDVAASVGAATALVNDLDLTAKSPSLTSYTPWVLDSSPNVTSLNTPATRGVDHLNPIEQITVDDPEPGTWTFNVTGYNVPSGPQTYYLVYEFLTEELKIAYPLKNERIKSGETYYLRWDSYGTSGTFDLSYELDGSGTWNPITVGYDATKRVFSWIAPNVTGIHTIKFSVTRGGTLTDQSDVNYIGAVPGNLSVQSASGSNVNLSWGAVNGATGYKVYKLGNKYMEEVTTGITYNGTSAAISGQSTSSAEYYAVSAVTGTNEGQRTMTITKTVGNYVSDPQSLNAVSTGSSQINLSWTKNIINSDVIVAWSPTATFGTPANGSDYAVGSSISGGGTVLYKGSLAAFNHTGLTPYTSYYYKIWSVTGDYTYSSGITSTATTDCGTASKPTIQIDFSDGSLPNCWKNIDNTGNGAWQFGTTTAGGYTPTLTGNYAYVNTSGVNNSVNTDLISPTLNLTDFSNITVSFNHYFLRAVGGTATASVYYSIDNGTTWTQLTTFSSTGNPSAYTSSVITALAGQSQARLKWSYTSTASNFFWAIDDIKIDGIIANPSAFTAVSSGTNAINLSWTKNSMGNDVVIAVSSSSTFGTPVNGTDYSVGSSIAGGGTVVYKGNLTSFAHTGLSPATTYYYKIWSLGSQTYSSGIAANETTDCSSITALPFSESFASGALPNCWKAKDNTGNGTWQFGSTTNTSNPPTILTAPYAYFKSVSGATVNYNADLISPSFDLSAYQNITLAFKQHFDTDATWTSTATVSYSTDNGVTWTALATYTTDQSNLQTSFVLPYIADKSKIRFKWNYTDNAIGSYMWGIDDVQVSDNTDNWTGAVSTDWFTTGNWSTGAIPTSSTIVVIPSAPTNQPQINATGAVCQDLTINSGASLTMNSSTAYTLSVSGDFVNNGTFTAGKGTVDFNGANALQTISGSSATTFYILSLSKVVAANILEVTSQINTSNSVLINSGTFKLNNSLASAIISASSTTITDSKGIWLNAGSLSSNADIYSWGGIIRVSGGTFDLSNRTISYNYNGSIIVEGGQLKLNYLKPYTAGSSVVKYIHSGGDLIVGISPSSVIPFDLTSTSTFNMSGGSIVVQKASGAAADYQNLASTYNVTGGTLQIGNASTATSQMIRINSTVPVYNLVVNSYNSPSAKLVTNGLTVLNNCTIGSGAKLDLNSLTLSTKGNWINNGGTLTTTPTGTVTFNGTTAQTIGGTSGTLFNNLTLNNSNGLSLNSVDATVNGTLTLTSGVITTGSNKLVISSSGSVSRTSGHINGYLQKSIATGSSVSKTFEIGSTSETAYKPATVTFATVSTAGSLTGSTTTGEHPQISSSTLNPDKSIGRYWTLTNIGIVFDTYGATFNFSSDDVDATATVGNMIAGKYSSSAWTYPSVSGSTATSVTISGVTSFSDFQFAEQQVATGIKEGTTGDTKLFVNANNQIEADVNDCANGYILTVYNGIGQILVQKESYAPKTIVTNKLTPGIYLVSVKTPALAFNKKLIIK